MTNTQFNFLSGQLLGACIEVHKQLGLGLLESVYEYSLMTEFFLRNINAKNKIGIPLIYKGINTGKVFEIDILIENEIVVELKTVEILDPEFTAQLITYLKLAGKRLGFFINFNVPLLKNGFKRFVNNLLIPRLSASAVKN